MRANIFLAVLICISNFGCTSTPGAKRSAIVGEVIPKYGPGSTTLSKDISKTKLSISDHLISKSPLVIDVSVANVSEQNEESVVIFVEEAAPEIIEYHDQSGDHKRSQIAWTLCLEQISLAPKPFVLRSGETRKFIWTPTSNERKKIEGKTIRLCTSTLDNQNFGGGEYFSSPFKI